MSQPPTPAEEPAPAAPRTWQAGRVLAVGLGIAAAVFLVDLASKQWVIAHLTLNQPVEVLGSLLRWRLIYNPGAAFSFGTGITWVFTLFSAVVSTAIVAMLVRKVRSVGWTVGLGLILGGALGNLADRLFREPGFARGHVVDFIQLPNFAVFNLADSAITCGAVWVVLMTFRGVELDGSRPS